MSYAGLGAVLFFAVAFAQGQGSGRVDPHGTATMRLSHEEIGRTSACTACHQKAGSKFTVRAGVEKTCLNCHSPSPHSGVDEHLKHKISCLDCHSPHRADRLEIKSQKSFLKNQPALARDELELRAKPDAMIKKDCVSCHTWKKVRP
ncbi:MAG TPA: cytochrome c3 family protein [Bdellovibrionales bacterium]|nr:cytochrome c3 family protein [Bdellovibrionales bacterium]